MVELQQNHRSHHRNRHYVMEPVSVTIGGKEVQLAWTQDVARRLAFRASRIGGGPSFADFRNQKKAAAAITTFLWLILPVEVHAKFSTPEDLFLAIDHETEAAAIHAACIAVIGSMQLSADEKKTPLKTPSPASSSDSPPANGEIFTRKKQVHSSRHGKTVKAAKTSARR